MKKNPPRKLTPRALGSKAMADAGGGYFVRYGADVCQCGNPVWPNGWCSNCGGYQEMGLNPY